MDRPAVDPIGVPCMVMRAGSSKGAFILADDLPSEVSQCCSASWGPGPRQIDGLGGAHPLSSKLAAVSPSPLEGVDVDYLFLRFGVDQRIVTA